jgi:hypothetical protein
MNLTFRHFLIFLILNNSKHDKLFSQKNENLIKKYKSVQMRQNKDKQELVFNSSHSEKTLKKKSSSDLISSDSLYKKLLNDIILIDQNYRDNIQLFQKINNCQLKLTTFKNELNEFNLYSLELKDETNLRNYNEFYLKNHLNEQININYQKDLDDEYLNNEFLNSSNFAENEKISTSLIHRRIKSIKKKLADFLK